MPARRGGLVSERARRQPAAMGLYSEHVRPRLHMFALNDRITGATRDRVCSGLSGDVLEIGYGSGLNQPHLPAGMTGVLTIEPSVTVLRLGAQRPAAFKVPKIVSGDDAQ